MQRSLKFFVTLFNYFLQEIREKIQIKFPLEGEQQSNQR